MDFRGAVVEDLDLPPPKAVFESTTVAEVLDLVLEDGPEAPPVVPVLRASNRVVGYVLADDLVEGSETAVKHVMHSETPSTEQTSVASPVESLVAQFPARRTVEIWDASALRVLAVATEHDVHKRLRKLT